MEKKKVIVEPAESLQQNKSRMLKNPHLDYNVTVDESIAEKSMILSIDVLKPPIKILNRSVTILPSCSRTSPSPAGQKGNCTPLVTYQTFPKIGQTYPLVLQKPLLPKGSNLNHTVTSSNQLINLETNRMSYWNQNTFNRQENQGVSKRYPVSTERQYSRIFQKKPEMSNTENISESPRGAQKQRSIKIYKKNMTGLEEDSKKKMTPSSSVASFLEQDILDKEIEVLDSLDEQTLYTLTAKVMDLTNRMYGDYLAEELIKHLGPEKYREIANQGITSYREFLARRHVEVNKENLNPVGGEASSSELFEESGKNSADIKTQKTPQASDSIVIVKPQKSPVFIKIDPKSLLKLANPVQPKGFEKMPTCSGQKITVKANINSQNSVQYQIEAMSSESPEFLSIPANQKNASSPSKIANLEKIAEEVIGNEEKLAADLFISERIAHFEKIDSSTEDSFDEKFTFDDSKMNNGPPKKIFESPEEPSAGTPKPLFREKCHPRKLLQVDGTNKNEIPEKSSFLDNNFPGDVQRVDSLNDNDQISTFSEIEIKKFKHKLHEKMCKSRGSLISDQKMGFDPLLSTPSAHLENKSIISTSSESSASTFSRNTSINSSGSMRAFEETFSPGVVDVRPEIKAKDVAIADEANSKAMQIMLSQNHVEKTDHLIIRRGDMSQNTLCPRIVTSPKIKPDGPNRNKLEVKVPLVKLEQHKEEIISAKKSLYLNTEEKSKKDTPKIVKSIDTKSNFNFSLKDITRPQAKEQFSSNKAQDLKSPKKATLQCKNSEEVHKNPKEALVLSPRDKNLEHFNKLKETIKLEGSVLLSEGVKKELDGTKEASVIPKNNTHQSRNSLQLGKKQQKEVGISKKTSELKNLKSSTPQNTNPKRFDNEQNKLKSNLPKNTQVKKESGVLGDAPELESFQNNKHHNRNSQKDLKDCLKIEEEIQLLSEAQNLKSSELLRNNKPLNRNSQNDLKECPKIEEEKQDLKSSKSNTIENRNIEKLDEIQEMKLEGSVSRDLNPEQNKKLQETKETILSEEKANSVSPEIIKSEVPYTESIDQRLQNTASAKEKLPPTSRVGKYLKIETCKKEEQTFKEKVLDKESLQSDSSKNINAVQQYKEIEPAQVRLNLDLQSSYQKKSSGDQQRNSDSHNHEKINESSKPGAVEKQFKIYETHQKSNLLQEGKECEMKRETPEQKILSKSQKDGSPDLETSMNDLAQLLISLQDSCPTSVKTTSDSGSISNESFELFAQNTVKSVVIESDDCILIEEDSEEVTTRKKDKVEADATKKCAQQALHYCDLTVEHIPGCSRSVNSEKDAKTDDHNAHPDKSVKDVAQILIGFQKSGINMTKVNSESSKIIKETVETDSNDDCVLIEVESETPENSKFIDENTNCNSHFKASPAIDIDDEDCVMVEDQSYLNTQTLYPSVNKIEVDEQKCVRLNPFGMPKKQDVLSVAGSVGSPSSGDCFASVQHENTNSIVHKVDEKLHKLKNFRTTSSCGKLASTSSTENYFEYAHYRIDESNSQGKQLSPTIDAVEIDPRFEDNRILQSRTNTPLNVVKIEDAEWVYRNGPLHSIKSKDDGSRGIKIASHVKNIKDRDYACFNMSEHIVKTPLSRRSGENGVELRYRRNRKMKMHEQRNLLRNKVRSLSRIIHRRIKTIRRTYDQFKMLVGLINLNIDDINLDNCTLKYKIKNLITIRDLVNKTFMAFKNKDLRELKVAFGKTRFALGGKNVSARIGKKKKNVLKKKKLDSASIVETIKIEVEKDEDETADEQDVVPELPRFKEVYQMPLKTYSKVRKNIFKTKSDSDSNLQASNISREDNFQIRSISFCDEIRKYRLDWDEMVQNTIRSTSTPESSIQCVIYKDPIPTVKEEILIPEFGTEEPTEIGKSPSPEVVFIKQELPDYSTDSEVSYPQEQGQKRKTSYKTPRHDEDESPVKKRHNLKKDRVIEPETPYKRRRSREMPDVLCAPPSKKKKIYKTSDVLPSSSKKNNSTKTSNVPSSKKNQKTVKNKKDYSTPDVQQRSYNLRTRHTGNRI